MDHFIDILLNGIAPIDMFAYMIVGYFGVLTKTTMHLARIFKGVNFKFKIFWQKNKLSLFGSCLMVPFGVVFSQQMFDIELSTWTAFLSGISTQVISETILKRKKNGESDSSQSQEDFS